MFSLWLDICVAFDTESPRDDNETFAVDSWAP